jgi:hypothetical protein
MQNSPFSNGSREPTLTPATDAACREFAGLADLLTGIAALPRLLRLLEEHALAIKALTSEVKALRSGSQGTADGWLDAKGAAEYLDMSAGTFDKFRYQTTPKIKGYRVGGKTLYKRADLDNFVMLFEVKSQGLA